MRAIWKFRLFVLVVVVLAGGIAISDLAAEIVRPDRLPLRSISNGAVTPNLLSAAGLAATIAPYRSDLRANYALALAGMAGSNAQGNDAAKDAAISALRIGPHDSRMWLLLSLLRARSKPGDQLVVEALKMSYLTGPNLGELIPIRIAAVTSGNSLNDLDLNDLARGDVRAILTQSPDQRQLLVTDYVRASPIGKTFLETSARTIDPAFADQLHSSH